MKKDIPARPRRFYTNKLIRSLFFIILFIILLGLLTPVGIKWYLQKWLVENGAEKAVIESIGINPFNGSVTVQGADIQRDGNVVFANSSIHVNFNLWKLLSKRAHFDKVVLSNVELDIEQYEEKGFRVASYELIPVDTTDAAAAKHETASNGGSGTMPWFIHAQHVELSNVMVKFSGQGLSLRLAIEEGIIDRLGNAPEDRDGRIFVKGAVNDAPFVIDAKAFSLVPGVNLEGTVSWRNYDLSLLETFLREAVHPFKGTAGIDGDVKMEIDGENNISASFDGNISLEQADIGGEGWAVKGDTTWNGDIAYAMTSAPDVADSVQLNGELAGKNISVHIPEQFDLTQEKFSITSETIVSLTKNVDVDSEGTFVFDNGTYNVSETLTSNAANISWQGRTRYQSGAERQNINIKGQLRGEQVRTELFSQDILINGESIVLNSDLGITLGEQFLLDGESGSTLDEIQVAIAGEPLVSLSEIHVTGFAGNATGGLDVSQVEVTGISVPISRTVPVAIAARSLVIDSIASQGLEGGSVQEVRLDMPVVMDSDEKQLAVFDSVALQDIQGNSSGKVEVKHAAAIKGKFLGNSTADETPLLQLHEINGKDLSWNTEEGFVGRLITLDSLLATYTREKNDDSGQNEETTAGEQQKQEEMKGLPVRIDRIELSGTSSLTFIDTTLTSGFSTSLFLTRGEVIDVDFNEPEKPFTYSFTGNFDKYAPVQVEGRCAPLAPSFFLENKAKLNNFPLEKLSPYVVDSIGTYFKSGQLDINSALVIKGEDLEVKNNFLFKDLDSETVDPELAAKLNNSLPVPLDLALSMLRDSDGNIDLDVPVSGKMSDLNVGISDILITAMSKAITVSVAPYIAYTFLGPTGALVYLGTQLGQKMMSTDLPDISFEPGQEGFSEAQEKILARVGASIADNDQNYSICAKVALSELGDQFSSENSNSYAIQDEEARKQLFQIGETLSLRVQQFLIDQFNIKAERLLICNPGFRIEEGAKTTIEFMR